MQTDAFLGERGANKEVSATGASLKDWKPDSWQAREALQQPNYDDEAELETVLEEIATRPPLVFAGEARSLQAQLANAAAGNAFVLFGGDCAESFEEFHADYVRDTYRVLLQMSVILMYGAGVPVVKLGRMAGQFAKPRSEDLETINGVSLPSYRGDNINSSEFTPEARRPRPEAPSQGVRPVLLDPQPPPRLLQRRLRLPAACHQVEPRLHGGPGEGRGLPSPRRQD